MNIHESTTGFENWLRQQLADRGQCDDDALDAKHAAMKKEGAHAFLRGTFYRWVGLWAEAGDGGSVVRAIGDTHVENFGTWRDAEGRLVWGVNDFDEACELSWTSDLVRLGVSTTLALGAMENFQLPAEEACGAVLAGYAEALISGAAAPLVLAENNEVLREFALKLILSKPPEKFWKKKIGKLDQARDMPDEAKVALEAALPDGATKVEFLQPKADDPPGMGSRGKRRFYALAIWKGARVLREAKPVVPSALAFAKDGDPGAGLAEMILSPRRCADPFQSLQGKWVVRRIAADSSKIELEDLDEAGADAEMTRKVFESMGAELANLHLGSGNAAKLPGELDARGKDGKWFHAAVGDWTKKVNEDFAEFSSTGT